MNNAPDGRSSTGRCRPRGCAQAQRGDDAGPGTRVASTTRSDGAERDRAPPASGFRAAPAGACPSPARRSKRVDLPRAWRASSRQPPAAGGLELRHGVEVRCSSRCSMVGLEAEVTSAANRLAAAAWAAASGSSSVQRRWRRAGAAPAPARGQRARPPNWPTTTRQVGQGPGRVEQALALAQRRRPGPAHRSDEPRTQGADRVGPHTPSGAGRSCAGSPRAPARCAARRCRRPGRSRSRAGRGVACSSATSSPRRFGATRNSSRSPSFQRRLDQRRQVASSHSPSTRRPRCSWNARTRGFGGSGRTRPPRRRRAETRRRRGGVAGRGRPRRARPGVSGKCRQKFVELLQQLALALGADQPLRDLAPSKPAGWGCSSR